MSSIHIRLNSLMSVLLFSSRLDPQLCQFEKQRERPIPNEPPEQASANSCRLALLLPQIRKHFGRKQLSHRRPCNYLIRYRVPLASLFSSQRPPRLPPGNDRRRNSISKRSQNRCLFQCFASIVVCRCHYFHRKSRSLIVRLIVPVPSLFAVT